MVSQLGQRAVHGVRVNSHFAPVVDDVNSCRINNVILAL